jgi:hypothetical protein
MPDLAWQVDEVDNVDAVESKPKSTRWSLKQPATGGS